MKRYTAAQRALVRFYGRCLVYAINEKIMRRAECGCPIVDMGHPRGYEILHTIECADPCQFDKSLSADRGYPIRGEQ